MISQLFALLFCFLFIRELRNPTEGYTRFSVGYITLLGLIMVACIWPTIRIWQFEHHLSQQASIITQRPGITVECNSFFDSIRDGHGVTRFGSAYIEQGRIVFEQNWCSNFIRYLNDPASASGDVLFSLTVFTHELMHIKGERDEQKNHCQAVQRSHLVAEMLGVPKAIARQHAKISYQRFYDTHPYYTRRCRPGGKLDEHLPNSIWN